MDERPKVTLRGPLDLAAAVPSLVGFTPGRGSLVMVTFEGRKLGLTVRADYAPRVADALHDALSRQQGVTRVDLIGWGVLPADTDYVYAALRALDVPMRECLTVQEHDGGWRVCDTCPDVDVPEWQPLPTDLLRPVMAVTYGSVVADSREQLAERIKHTPGHQLTDAQVDAAGRLSVTRDRDKIVGMLATCELAELLPLREEFAAVARAYPPGDLRRDGALSCVAVCSYLTGDGAMTAIALDACTPTYPFARLLRMALSATVPPEAVRAALVAAGIEAAS